MVQSVRAGYGSVADGLAGEKGPRWRLARAAAASFDHFVGAGEERRQDFQAEGPGCLHVDRQFEFGGLLDKQITRLLALGVMTPRPADAGLKASEVGAVPPIEQSGVLVEYRPVF
jgi:hypothetical protein